MGRHVRNDSESPVRDHGSPRRRSPSRKSQSRTEKSPARERKSHRGSSPLREKHSSRPKSPKHARSPSPPPRSPSPRTKRLRKAEAERVVSGRERDAKHARSPSPPPRSPSPQTKRLRRAEAERGSGREHERINDRGMGRDLQESGSERDVRSDRKEKVSGRNDTDDKSSRSRRGTSPSDRHHRSRHRSRSPQHAGDTRDGDKVSEGRGRNHSRGSDESMHREKGSDRENKTERMERRTAKDSTGHRSSRSRHEKSTSPLNGHHKNRHRNHSSQQNAYTGAHDEVPESREAEDGINENDSVAMMKAAEEALEAKKQKPSFELSGKLAAETNRFRGITLLYTEPPEARKPTVRWRLYVFKGGEVLDEPLKIHRQSCYLFGRERRVADVPTDHPSCSKQHAVIQFREVEKEQPDGMMSKEIKPYIMDLGSTNKTFVNESAIEPQRYYELMERDTIKFGNSRVCATA